MDFKDKQILIAGAGKSGICAANLLNGYGARILLYDGNANLDRDTIVTQLDAPQRVEIIVGEFPEKLLQIMDLMILSPGIAIDTPFVERVRKEGVPIWSEVELAFVLSKGKLVAITGTNGKTTTTALTGAILSAYYKKVHIVGNIGIPYTAMVTDLDENTVTIAEISSFQLETIHTFHPDISVVLNITPDHLNRHYTMERYTQCKMRIMENQTLQEPVVLNYEDPILRTYAKKIKNKIIWFSRKQKVEHGVYVDSEKIYYKDDVGEYFVVNISDTTLVGWHNTENIMAAIAVAFHMGVPIAIIREEIRKFRAVEHRIEYVRTVNDVIYYNDSKGTNADASIKAIEAMQRPTVLIAGGYDKKVSFEKWAQSFGNTVKCLLVMGETAPQIVHTVKEQGFYDVICVNDLKEAVMKSHEIAVPGDAVLLSPACASWDMFQSYQERGNCFKQYVHSLSDESGND